MVIVFSEIWGLVYVGLIGTVHFYPYPPPPQLKLEGSLISETENWGGHRVFFDVFPKNNNEKI